MTTSRLNDLKLDELDEASLQDLWKSWCRDEPPHPLIPFPPEDVALEKLRRGELDVLVKALQMRREFVGRAISDPLNYEPEPVLWRDADALLMPGRRGDRSRLVLALAVLGGNRSSKSFYCGKRLMKDAVEYPGSLMLCLAEDVLSSIRTQQEIVWHYMPAAWKALNGRRHSHWSIHYSVANGFSDRRLVLPNGTRIIFKTYNENPDEVEGWEFGAKTGLCVGVWADENLRLPWLQVLLRRTKFRAANLLWSFTPVHGMTPALKELLGDGEVKVWRAAKLLPDRVNVAGGPPGQMPYVRMGVERTTRAIYFHTELSPFGPGPNGAPDSSGRRYFDAVREDCDGKSSDYVRRVAYGWCDDVAGRKFPHFGPCHVIPTDELPAEGTNYMLTDPHGDRPWATIWVRITPDRRMVVYRDWPAKRQYGEWAIPSSRELGRDSKRGWDGDPGPAQRSQGFAFWRYKQIWLEQERLPTGLFNGRWLAKDPQAKKALDQWMFMAEQVPKELNSNGEPCWTVEQVEEVLKKNEPPRESIQLRYADPRALANPSAANDEGAMTLYIKFQEEQRDGDGNVLAPRMVILPAFTGKGIEEGCALLNDLIDFDQEKPIGEFNRPRLLVVEEAEQVRWALMNYTGIDPDGACKDWIDLLRYAVQSNLTYISPDRMARTTGCLNGPI